MLNRSGFGSWRRDGMLSAGLLNWYGIRSGRLATLQPQLSAFLSRAYVTQKVSRTVSLRAVVFVKSGI